MTTPSLAEQVGVITEIIRETETVKFQSYGTQQRLRLLGAARETLIDLMNNPPRSLSTRMNEGEE